MGIKQNVNSKMCSIVVDSRQIQILGIIITVANVQVFSFFTVAQTTTALLFPTFMIQHQSLTLTTTISHTPLVLIEP